MVKIKSTVVNKIVLYTSCIISDFSFEQKSYQYLILPNHITSYTTTTDFIHNPMLAVQSFGIFSRQVDNINRYLKSILIQRME